MIEDAPAFGIIAERVREHALRDPQHVALRQDDRALAYGELDRLMDRIAHALQRDRVRRGETIAICAGTSIEYAAIFLGALRAGVAVAPLPPDATAASVAGMIEDCDARVLFLDGAAAHALASVRDRLPARRVAIDGGGDGLAFDRWVAPADARAEPVAITPDMPFNIIYSSGTTGAPKGIVQPHAMRWAHVRRSMAWDYGGDCVTLLATPLYSNTTLVAFFPTIAGGGTVVTMARFDAAAYLALAARVRATHTMLVPVQYRRIMALPGFERYDLGAFRFKFCTSAPFPAALKADVLARWPGGLVEFYGMTEGGGTCILLAHERPDKLHTVGRPAEGHDIRLIDDAGCEVAAGETGEVVGRSPGMMTGYHRRPDLTAAAEWFDARGRRFIRTGDIGRFDAEGFLVLMDRRKDMIISGGFNLYPSDLEAVLLAHPDVVEAAVVGMPSETWGESPAAFVVLCPGASITPEAVRAWANDRLGKTQRIVLLRRVDALPRSAIGKVMKRELRALVTAGTDG
jgi:acyl-CoA synthetase (AMP-forming)/AMP-acid ligase II